MCAMWIRNIKSWMASESLHWANEQVQKKDFEGGNKIL